MNRFVDVLENQKQEMADYLNDQGMVRRQVAWSLDLKGTQAQIVIGIRRCGKSVLCRTALGDAEVVFGYVDFDDVMLAHLEPAELEELLKAVYVVYGEVDCIFFDEIQNVAGFEEVINGFRTEGDYSIFITGSNSYLLSGELMTKLTGRYLEFEMFPLTFDEYEDMKRFYGKDIHLNTEIELKQAKENNSLEEKLNDFKHNVLTDNIDVIYKYYDLKNVMKVVLYVTNLEMK